ncbi:Hpt domain-containing protein [Ochrovirga pacifica]|uniref:Hpt domain-containing protein n=1 Tax=Ochrovirga pacifica TaxID=1042376 RepID=UPI0002559DA4|nr:Hpt domain-containing protein [Ochrovirga pacifica]
MEQPNLNYIKEISGGDADFQKEMIQVIQKEFPTEVATYHQTLAVKDYRGIAEIVHKIKHKISILGLEESYKTAMVYEENLREHSFEKQAEFEKTLQNMTDFLASL